MADFRHETDRLVLRDWRDGDAEAFFAATNTPAVMRWLGGVMDDDARAAQLARVRTCHANHGFCFWIVQRKADGGHLSGEVLGFCGLKRADAPGSSVVGAMEAGWRLREDAWGHGYAKEAAAAALALGFERFAADRIVALTVDGNAPSWGLMTRLGMQRRADLDYQDPRYGPDLNPTIVYAITADQWRRASRG
ncbi:GNAT family N-acetyltransferase [Erythrobacter arachoides]|uniref:GNAT family N-acetyltransferase n=1 Tax=Aurantiacibacter arachoides TaxID=1850444 RepID=A0A845AAU3_9SPHN|nr:GNAT family N-acetyltransferase [Aurantiacibacter arachoides]MXO94669.1 GNAT family N-acetyltransferase [Aurantiacibacter arachoides]GGD61638.1 N-acetyltransferase [Aurantiacibacter arachoides]